MKVYIDELINEKSYEFDSIEQAFEFLKVFSTYDLKWSLECVENSFKTVPTRMAMGLGGYWTRNPKNGYEYPTPSTHQFMLYNEPHLERYRKQRLKHGNDYYKNYWEKD